MTLAFAVPALRNRRTGLPGLGGLTKQDSAIWPMVLGDRLMDAHLYTSSIAPGWMLVISTYPPRRPHSPKVPCMHRVPQAQPLSWPVAMGHAPQPSVPPRNGKQPDAQYTRLLYGPALCLHRSRPSTG